MFSVSTRKKQWEIDKNKEKSVHGFIVVCGDCINRQSEAKDNGKMDAQHCVSLHFSVGGGGRWGGIGRDRDMK